MEVALFSTPVGIGFIPEYIFQASRSDVQMVPECLVMDCNSRVNSRVYSWLLGIGVVSAVDVMYLPR